MLHKVNAALRKYQNAKQRVVHSYMFVDREVITTSIKQRQHQLIGHSG